MTNVFLFLLFTQVGLDNKCEDVKNKSIHGAKKWTEKEKKKLIEAVQKYPDCINHMQEIANYVGTNRSFLSYYKRLQQLKSSLPVNIKVS